MERNIWRSGGLVFSQRVLLALVASGLSREAAYAIVQRHAMRAWEEGGDFRQSLAADPEVGARLGPDALNQVFDVHSYLQYAEEILHRAGIPEEVS